MGVSLELVGKLQEFRVPCSVVPSLGLEYNLKECFLKRTGLGVVDLIPPVKLTPGEISLFYLNITLLATNCLKLKTLIAVLQNM